MPPRSTNAPKLTTDDTTPSRISPTLRLVRNWSRDLLLRLFEVGTAAEHDVVAVLVELDDLGLHASCRRTGCRSRTRRSSTSDAGRKPRRPMSTMRPPLTTSITGPSTTPSASLIFSIVPHARSYWARFLDRTQATLLVLLGEHEGFDLLAERDDLVRVDVVADAQLASRDDTFALVADVEQHLVLVDLDDGAVDELAVLDFDHRAVDGIGEGHAEIVDDDLAGGVVAFVVEGAHGGRRERGVGQDGRLLSDGTGNRMGRESDRRRQGTRTNLSV